MKSRKSKRSMRLPSMPSMKSVRHAASSFFQSAKRTGKKVVRTLRRATRRLSCRRR